MEQLSQFEREKREIKKYLTPYGRVTKMARAVGYSNPTIRITLKVERPEDMSDKQLDCYKKMVKVVLSHERTLKKVNEGTIQ